MKIEANQKIYWNGERHKILYASEESLLLKNIDDLKDKLVNRDDFHIAIRNGEVEELSNVGFSNIEQDHEFQALPEWQRNRIMKKMVYAQAFFNVVPVTQQYQLIESIQKEHGFSEPPPPSTVRRWAQRYKESNCSWRALIDRRSLKVIGCV